MVVTAVAVVAVAALLTTAIPGFDALRSGGPGVSGSAGTAALGDPRTADPCSLIDTAALARHGTVRVDQADVSFAGCRAEIRQVSGSRPSLFVEFGLPPASTDVEGEPQQIGQVVLHRLRPSTAVCARDLLLPDKIVVSVYAQRLDNGTEDLCTIADTGATAAAAILNSRGTGVREPLDITSPLAGVDACSLLGAADVAAVPGTLAPGTPGFGRWSCSWGTADALSVYINYYRGQPPDPDGPTAVSVVAGRSDGTRRRSVPNRVRAAPLHRQPG